LYWDGNDIRPYQLGTLIMISTVISCHVTAHSQHNVVSKGSVIWLSWNSIIFDDCVSYYVWLTQKHCNISHHIYMYHYFLRVNVKSKPRGGVFLSLFRLILKQIVELHFPIKVNFTYSMLLTVKVFMCLGTKRNSMIINIRHWISFL